MAHPKAVLIAATATALAAVSCTSAIGSANTSSTSAPTSVGDPSASASTHAPAKLPAGVLASIPLDSGSAPGPVGSAFGSIWVGSHCATTLYRIDPHSDSVIARIDLNQETCNPITVGAGLVWANFCDDSNVEIAVDPRTNQVVGALHSNWVYGFANGTGWGAAQNGDTVRFDPKTLRIVATLPVRGVNGVIAGRYLWLAGGDPDTSQYNGIVTKVDPRTGKVLGRIRTPTVAGVPFFTPAPGALWLKGNTDSSLIRIDMATGKASRFVIPHFETPEAFGDAIPVVAMGSLWLRTADGAVSRLNARTGRHTRTYPADPNGGGGYVAVGDGSLWIGNFSTDTVWRDKI